MPRRSAGKQQRLSKSGKKESREAHSPSRNNTRTQETPVKAHSERASTKHLSRADAEEHQDLKRQLFKSSEHINTNKVLASTTENISVGNVVLSSSLPHAMLSLAEVEEKLHSSVTTANNNSGSSSSSVVIQPHISSKSHLIDPSSFAVPAATTASMSSSKSAVKLTKAASLDVKQLPHSFSQPMLVDGSTLQVPSHFPPVPPVMVSPGMRSAPVSSSSDQGLVMKPVPSSSTPVIQTTPLYTKQQQPTVTTEGKPLPPSSYQTPNKQAPIEPAVKELPVTRAQNTPQNGLLTPMGFQDNSAVHSANKPTAVLNREQFLQAMLYMIQVRISSI